MAFDDGFVSILISLDTMQGKTIAPDRFVIIVSFWYIRATILRPKTMPKMKTDSDIKRFARYQLVLHALLAVDSFRKPEIYEMLRDEKPWECLIFGNSMQMNNKGLL